MKLYNIPNADMFLRKVMNLTGGAYCVQANGEKADLKALAQSLIQSGMANQMGGIREIDLQLENQSDAMALMSFAAQMIRGERAA